MKGLLQLGKLQEQMPLVYDWLKHAEATRRLVRENYASHEGEELLEITIAENVLTQIDNLKTYPVIHSRLYQGRLKIYGWIYMIETGEVLAYEPDKHAYIAPQSQLEYDSAEGLRPKKYTATQAPPVTCEVPYLHPEVDYVPEVAASSSSNAANGGAFPGDLSQLWLSPEQANRIYRGAN
jgi:carbonic anhydrase